MLLHSNRFTSVSFASLSPSSTTIFSRVFDNEKCSFVRPVKYDELTGLETEIVPPRFKEHKGVLSEKGSRNLRKSINSLLLSVDENILIDGTGKEKVSFITLTLASSQIKKYGMHYVEHWATDKEIKAKCLNQLMIEFKEVGVTANVWVSEKQANGNLHFHILTNIPINPFWLRKRWNALQNKFGFVDRYQAKMKTHTLKTYIELRSKECKTVTDKKMTQFVNAYNHGVKTNWTDPNSTDIQPLQKVGNISAYISKYMSKGFSHESAKVNKHIKYLEETYYLTKQAIEMIYQIEGRIWQCTQNVSKARKLIMYLEEHTTEGLAEMSKHIDEKKIFVEERFTTILHSCFDLKKYCLNTFDILIQHTKIIYYGLISNTPNTANILSDYNCVLPAF